MSCLCSMVAGPSAEKTQMWRGAGAGGGRLNGWGYDNLKFSTTHIWCLSCYNARLASVGLLTGAPAMASPCGLGSSAWWLAFKKEHLERKHFKKTRWKLQDLFCPWLRSQAMPCSTGDKRDIGHSRFRGRGIRLHLLMEWWQSYTAEGHYVGPLCACWRQWLYYC